MELATCYSAATAQLVRAGRVRLDRCKCPAWEGATGAGVLTEHIPRLYRLLKG